MANIDNRVVEMQFRREDFLKGTDETLSALDKLEGSLTRTGGLTGGLDKMGGAFSAFSTMATGGLLKLGSMAVDAGASLVKNVFDPIVQGGRKRSLNLEHANFQLQGIMANAKGVKDPVAEVAKIMESVSYAVDGTAYGLDAAAVAAAQFAATGMRGGEEMSNALRGISGVAAMAGSSYEDVASIFTKVAGQGRLMGDDLNRLATRGINAAATLGEAMGITEAEVRAMASDGQVSFEMFAVAMNNAFGEHATKANETYAGSLSNVKSALGRIGAEYFTIELEKQRRIFNAIRPVINNFKKALDPVWKLYREFVAMPMAEKIEGMSKAVENWGGWADLSRAMTAVFQIGLNVRDMFTSWLAPVGEAFRMVFTSGGAEESWISKLANWLEDVAHGTDSLKPTADQANAVRDAFVKVFGAVSKFVDIVKAGFSAVAPIAKAVWQVFLDGIDLVLAAFDVFWPYLQEGWDFLFGTEGKITEFFKSFRAEIEYTGSVWEAMKKTFSDFSAKYLKPISDVVSSIKDAFDNLKAGNTEGFMTAIANSLEPLKAAWEWLKGSGGAFGDFFGSLISPLKVLKGEFPPVGQALKDMFSWISDQFVQFGPVIDSVFTTIGDAMMALGKNTGDFLSKIDPMKLIEIADALSKLAVAIAAYKTLKAVEGTFTAISGFFGNLGSAITTFAENAKKEAQGNLFLKVAISLAILAGALWLLSKVPAADLFKAAVALGVMAGVMAFLITMVAKIDSKGMIGAAFAMGLLAFSLLGFITAIAILGLIPMDVLIQGGLALVALLVAIVAVGLLIGPLGQQLQQASFGILMLAGALTLMIIPIMMLGQMPYEQLIQGLGATIIMLAALALAALIIAEAGESLILGALGIAVLAGALTLMVIPIQALGEMPYEQLIQGLGATIVMLGVFVVAAMAMGSMGPGGALGLTVLSIAMIGFAAALYILASIPMNNIGGALVALAVALLLMVAASAAAGAVLPGVLGLAALMLAFGAAVLMIGAALLLAAAAFAIIVTVLPQFATNLMPLLTLMPQIAAQMLNMIAAGMGLTILGVGLLVVGVAALVLGVALLAVGGGMLMIKAAGRGSIEILVALVEAVAGLAKHALKLGAMALAFGGLGASLLVLGTGALVAAVGILLFSAGIMSLAIALGLAVIVMGIAAALAPLMAMGFSQLETAVGPLQSFSAALSFAVLAIGLYVAIATQMVGITNGITSSLGKASLGFITMSTYASTASVSLSTSASAMSTTMSTSASKIATSSDKIATSVNSLSTKIGSSAPRASSAVETMVKTISEKLGSGSKDVDKSSKKITKVFQDLPGEIGKSNGKIGNATSDVIKAIRSKLDSGKNDVQKAIDSYAKSFEKMASGISQNRSKVSDAAGTLTSAAKSGVNNGKNAAIDSAYKVGSAIAQGMANGISNGSSKVKNAANTAATTAMNSAKNTLGIKSPSREFFKIGTFMIEGWVNGLDDNVQMIKDSASRMGNNAIDAMDKALDGGPNGLGFLDDLSFMPTITPIVDSSLARNQISDLAGLLSSTLSSAQLSGLYNLERTLGGSMGGDSAGTPPAKIEYTQNNYSPKAISAADLYRQTRNQISTLGRL